MDAEQRHGVRRAYGVQQLTPRGHGIRDRDQVIVEPAASYRVKQ